MEVTGKIISGKSYKTRVTKNKSTEVKFSIKTDKTHYFRTYVDQDLEIPAFLKEGELVKVETEGGRPNSWEWKGKTYSDLQVHLSMIRRADASPAEEVGFEEPPLEIPDNETAEQRMWRLKERRDYKGRCLVYATETYKMSGEAKNLPIEDIQKKIQDLANEYLKYIYEQK
jgi:hypothetical protein